MITSDLRLQAFDLCWIPSGGIRDPKLNGASSPVLLLPGNSELAMDSSYGVLAVEVAKGRSLKEYKYFQTDIKRDISNPGRSISCGVVLGVHIVCICTGKKCNISSVTSSREGMRLTTVLEFDADFGAGGQSHLNSCCITKSGHIVTGGDDGICRIWTPSKSTGGWNVVLKGELKGHRGPIICVRASPVDNWLLTCSLDGCMLMWDEDKRVVMGESLAMRLSDGGNSPTSPSSTINNNSDDHFAMSCFSADGGFVYTIQYDPASESSVLVKWAVSTIPNENNSYDKHIQLQQAQSFYSSPTAPQFLLEFEPAAVATLPKKCQCTHLEVSASGEFVAVGCSDGSIHMYSDAKVTLQKVHHPFNSPIIGMSFNLSVNLNFELLACCYKDKIVVLQVGGPSLAFKIMFLVLCLLFVLACACLFTLVVYEELSLEYISKALEYGKDMHIEL